MLRNRLTILPNRTDRSIAEEDGFATLITKQEDRNEGGLETVGKELVRGEVVYALVCKNGRDRIAERLKTAESRRLKNVCERRGRGVAQMERRSACLW